MAKEKQITRTFNELRLLNLSYQVIVRQYEDIVHSKFSYCANKFLNKLNCFNEYNREKEKLEIKYAATDERGMLIYNDPIQKQVSGRDFKYSPQNLEKLREEEVDLLKVWDKKEIVVEPFICKELPKELKLTESEIELFKGLII